MNKFKKCNTWLPPGYGIKCEKAIDPLCQEKCFQCCQRNNGSLPKTNYLRCQNPQHPPYKESEFSKQMRKTRESLEKEKAAQQWKYPYANEEIPESKTKLRNAIKRDIKLIKKMLPIEDDLLPNEWDDEMWGDGVINDLEEEIDKIKLVINHPQGLQAKLSLWEDYRETEEIEEEENE